MATSFPAETETCFPVIVLPTASSWFNWNWSNVFVLDNTPRDLLCTDTSIANVCRPSSMETLFFADNATVPFTLLMSPWRMLISLPEAKTTLPCVWIWLPISAVWWTWRWFLSLNSPYVSWFSVRHASLHCLTELHEDSHHFLRVNSMCHYPVHRLAHTPPLHGQIPCCHCVCRLMCWWCCSNWCCSHLLETDCLKPSMMFAF